MKMKRRVMRIRTKYILGFVCSCFVPLMFSIVFMLKVANDKLEDSAYEFVSAYSAQVTGSLSSFIDEFDIITKSLLVDTGNIEVLSNYRASSVTDRIEYQTEANRLMGKVSTLMKNVRNVSFCSAGGELYTYGRSNDSGEEEEIVSSDWFRNIQESNETVSISPLHTSPYGGKDGGGEKRITLARKLYSYRYSYIGTLFADFSPEDLVHMSGNISSSDILSNIRILIRNPAGELIYDSLPSFSPDDDTVSYRTQTDKLSLDVTVIISAANLRLSSAFINTAALTAAVLSIVITILISFPLSKGITKPLLSVQRQMKKAESGDYEIVPDDGSSLELRDLISNYNSMITKIRKLINDVYLAEIEQKNAKLLSLQMQINPHMLYNTLETIRMKALIQKDFQVAEMVKALARMFRVMLSTKQNHTIGDEVSYTRDYIMLQNIRYCDMISLSVDIPEDILACESLSMILQPLAENSIKHGFRDRTRRLNICISAVMDNGDIVLAIRDDGAGMDSASCSELLRRLRSSSRSGKNAVQDSIGLMNIRERFSLSYGSGYGLSLSVPEGGGFSVSLKMPAVKKSEEVQSDEVQRPSC